MAAHLPPESATARAIRPPEPDDLWDLDAHLLAIIADRLGVLQAISTATYSGQRKVKFPKSIPRPGLVGDDDSKTFGGGDSALPIDEMAEWLGWSTGRDQSSESRPTTDDGPGSAGLDTTQAADPAEWEQPAWPAPGVQQDPR